MPTDLSSRIVPSLEGVQDFSTPLTEKEAAKILQCSDRLLSAFRKLKILNPVHKINRASGRFAWICDPQELLTLKKCFETDERLQKNGSASPVDGHLWVLQWAESGYSFLDLGGEQGGIYLIDAAHRKYGLSTYSLRSAIAEGSLPERFIYTRNRGFHWWRVLLQGEVLLFKNESKAEARVNRGQWKTHGELCQLLNITSRHDRHELSECLDIWVELKWLEKQVSRWATEGKLPDNSKVSRPLITAVKSYSADVYKLAQVKSLWEDDLKQYVDETKKLIGKDGLETIPTHAHFRKKGIVGKRLRRLLRLAGVASIRRKGIHKYEVKYRGESPIQSRTKRGVTPVWLRSLLAAGPQLCAAINAKAARKRISPSALYNAFHELNCTGDRFCESNGLNKGDGVWSFWRLPGQSALSEEESLRLIADFRQSSGRKKTAPSSPQAVNAASDVNPASNNPTAAAVETSLASTEKQADRFSELREFAMKRLKGNGQRVVILACDNDGSFPLADLAVELRWQIPCDDAYNVTQQRINTKLKAAKLPWILQRKSNKATLKFLERK